MSLFKGANAGEGGSLRFEAQYSFVYPNGEEAGSRPFVLWDGPPPPSEHLQIVEKRASLALDENAPAGQYLARIKVCDSASERCITAETPFTLTP